MIAINDPTDEKPETVRRVLRHYGLIKTICHLFIDALQWSTCVHEAQCSQPEWGDSTNAFSA